MNLRYYSTPCLTCQQEDSIPHRVRARNVYVTLALTSVSYLILLFSLTHLCRAVIGI